MMKGMGKRTKFQKKKRTSFSRPAKTEATKATKATKN